MLVKTYGSAVYGVEAITITVEVNVMPGNIHYYIVGLPDSAVKESRSTKKMEQATAFRTQDIALRIIKMRLG